MAHAIFFLKYDVLSHKCPLRIENHDVRTGHHANGQFLLKLSDKKKISNRDIVKNNGSMGSLR